MQRVAAGGVRINKIICADEDNAFTLDPENPNASGGGYDDGTATVGGEYASEYTLILPWAYDGLATNTAGYGAGSDDPIVGGGYES